MRVLIGFVVASCVGGAASAQGTLYGIDVAGNLFTVDITTGAGTAVGVLPNGPFANAALPGYNEIEYDNTNGRAWAQQRDGNFAAQEFNITNAAGIGAPILNGASFHGLEEVGGVMYAAGFAGAFGNSLHILNPVTGAATPVGLFTQAEPIGGLAYDTNTGIMYGMTTPGGGGAGFSSLYTVNLGTGATTLVGNTGLRFGSLEFGPDGNLYAGGTGGGAENGILYRISTATGAASFIGPMGFGGVGNGISGLTLVIPAPGAASLAALAGIAVARRRR